MATVAYDAVIQYDPMMDYNGAWAPAPKFPTPNDWYFWSYYTDLQLPYAKTVPYIKSPFAGGTLSPAPKFPTRNDWDFWKVAPLAEGYPYAETPPKIKSPFAPNAFVPVNIRQLEASSITTTATYEAGAPSPPGT